jgi:PH domain
MPVLFVDDDENTQPSSTGNTLDNPAVQTETQTRVEASSFTKFIENTRRRLSSGRREDMNNPLDNDDDMLEGALISGYLQKMGRNGKWQVRWFETDGECLSYYKSKKRSKLLATLDLEKVSR